MKRFIKSPKTCLLRPFSLGILFICVISLSVPLHSARAQLVDDLDRIVKETIKELAELGFDEEKIVKKDNVLNGTRYVLLRIPSGKRVYDLSIMTQSKAFLSISYNGGIKFGRVRPFNSLNTAINIIDRTETRERKREAAKNNESNTAETQAQKEQAEKKKEERKTGSSATNRLSSSLDAVASGGSSEGGDKKEDEGGDGKDAEALSSEEFSGDPCGREIAGDPVSVTTGGIGQVAGSIGEAAMATAVAEAFSMGASGLLGDSSGVGDTQSSQFLDSNGASKGLGDITNFEGSFAQGNEANKTVLMRRVLLSFVDDDQIPESQQFRSLAQLYARFRKWAAGEGYSQDQVLGALRRLAGNLKIERKTFERIQSMVPQSQHYSFIVFAERHEIVLDPEISDPDSVGSAFFLGAGLYLKHLQPEMEKQRQDLREARRAVIELQDGLFATTGGSEQAAMENQLNVFIKTAESSQVLDQIMEENPFER